MKIKDNAIITRNIEKPEGAHLSKPAVKCRCSGHKRKPAYEDRDHDGRRIIRVPLADGIRKAKLYAEDWHRLDELGLTTGWTLASSGNGYAYVRAGYLKLGKTLSVIARLIVGAADSDIVRYVTDDRLNLRRDNLKLFRRDKAVLRNARENQRFG